MDNNIFNEAKHIIAIDVDTDAIEKEMDRIVYMGNANVYVKTDIKANKQLYKYMMIHMYQQHVLYCDLLNIRNAIKFEMKVLLSKC